MLKKLLFVLFILSAVIGFTQNDDMFIYIPSEEEMQSYLLMRSYLQKWDNNEVEIDDARLSSLFTGYVGEGSLQSLLLESFLRFTKNENIQNRVIKYIEDDKLNTSFTNSLQKLYEARQIKRMSDGKEIIQYNYRNQEYDENINLFSVAESEVFNNELGLLLFQNDWTVAALNGENQSNEELFVLLYGGATNSMTISFRKYTNIEESAIETKFMNSLYDGRYKDNWTTGELRLDGILSRAGVNRMFILQGSGPDVIEGIESGTFTVYLYKQSTKSLYEVSYYMNFSPNNIHYAERNRIFNFIYFHLLFTYLN